MGERVELELELATDGQEGYRVTVRSPAGEESGRLLLDPASLLDRRAQMQANVLASAVTSRGVISGVEAPVRELGETLFHALFDEGVYATYKASLVLAAERGTQVRVVLRTQSAELAALPWEMMYDPEVGAYLCQREPLVRHVSVPMATHPLTVTPPLRILGVVAAPRDQARLDVEDEKQRLQTALAPVGSQVTLHWVEGGTWADLQRELVTGEWHVLHFVGHGDFDRHRQEGVLALENAQGTSDLISAERFGDLLTLQDPPLRLVLLNSCAGAQSAADDVFSSTAATLIRTGVSAVVAMQFAVSDPAAKAFAAGFYQAIASNRTVAEAVRIGRIGIRGLGEGTLEWVTPVLYLRGEDAALFNVLPDAAAPAGPSPEEAAREAAVQALYEEARARFAAGEHAEALAVLDVLLRDRDDYRDATALREQADRELRVAEAHAQATTAADRGDWAAAVEGYSEVMTLDPNRPGVQGSLDHGRLRMQVEALQADLRRHVEAADWSAAVSVADELTRLSPDDSDPDGLATRAREKLREENGGGGGGIPLRRLLTYAGGALVAVLLTVAVVRLWPDGDPPSPFRSAALYELARHHFDPGDCRAPQERGEAPALFDLEHTELLVCDGPDEAYFGSLVCMGDDEAFQSMRSGLLELGDDIEAVTAPPAGRSEPWPYQVSYRDDGNGRGRVLWDDGENRCAALLRAPTNDLDVTRGYFSEGTGS